MQLFNTLPNKVSGEAKRETRAMQVILMEAHAPTGGHNNTERAGEFKIERHWKQLLGGLVVKTLFRSLIHVSCGDLPDQKFSMQGRLNCNK